MTKTKSTTRYRPGDVVLVPFPFTDLTASKKRPALVLSPARMIDTLPDLVIAQITSKVARREKPGLGDYPLKDSGQAGLPLPSTVRLAKIATVSKELVIARMGRLTARDYRDAHKTFRGLFC